MTALALWGTGAIAADDETPQPSSEIRVKASGSGEATNQDVASEPEPAVTPAKPAGRVPTPAKRRSGAGLCRPIPGRHG